MYDQVLRKVIGHLNHAASAGDFESLLDPAVLDDARELAGALPADDSDLAAMATLGALHWERFRCDADESSRADDLRLAIRMHLPLFALGLPVYAEPLIPLVAEHAIPMAQSLTERASASYDEALAAQAVELWQRIGAALDRDDPRQFPVLSSLAVSLRIRYDLGRNAMHLNEAIGNLRRALELAPAHTPDRPYLLYALGDCLRCRFALSWDADDLNDAIVNLRESVATTAESDRQRLPRVASLVSALMARSRLVSGIEDADESIALCGRALIGVGQDSQVRAMLLSNLGTARLARFMIAPVNSFGDLDKALAACGQAVALASPNDPRRPLYLSSLANAHTLRSEHTGDVHDLDVAIELGDEAARTAARDDPDRGMYLHNLSLSLKLRFERVGDLQDADKAIAILERTVELTGLGNPDRARFLSALGMMARQRYRRSGASMDLAAAVMFGRQAVAAPSFNRHDEAAMLCDLSMSARLLYEETRSDQYLDEAVSAAQRASAAADADHPDQAAIYDSSSATLFLRYQQTNNAQDLNDAIDADERALAAAAPQHPGRATIAGNLGLHLRERHHLAHEPADRNRAVSALREAADTVNATPSARIRAARACADLLADSDVSEAARLLESAVGLLPQIASRRLQRSDQEHQLRDFANLAADAAALALGCARPGEEAVAAARALTLLEAGRGVLISQALDTRSDLSDLRAQEPALANRFAALRELLDQPDSLASPGADMAIESSTQAASRTNRRHQASEEYAKLIDTIRAEHQPGFLLPPSFEELLGQASQGPIAVLNVSRNRSDALVLTAHGVTAIPLPALTAAVVKDHVSSFQAALADSADYSGSLVQRHDAQEAIFNTLEWLWDQVAAPVLAALEGQPGFDSISGGQRMWWIPGGQLSQLPIHAAGYHRDTNALHPKTVMDRVVSSYTPSIQALLYARRQAPESGRKPPQSLVVAIPVVAEEPSIPGLEEIAREVTGIWDELPRPTLLVGEPCPPALAQIATIETPSADTILAHLRNASIAHFAAHGIADADEPSHSGLVLDSDGTRLTVASVAASRLDKAKLAYLSACHTAITSIPELVDESIHLAAAFQLAGFPQVIGTLWHILDKDAADIARQFYEQINSRSGGGNKLDSGALALHRTILERRGDPARMNPPFLWAAYLHTGA
jgi:hypothetical protein